MQVSIKEGSKSDAKGEGGEKKKISRTSDFTEESPSLGNRDKTSKGPRINSEELHPKGYDALELPLKS